MVYGHTRLSWLRKAVQYVTLRHSENSRPGLHKLLVVWGHQHRQAPQWATTRIPEERKKHTVICCLRDKEKLKQNRRFIQSYITGSWHRHQCPWSAFNFLLENITWLTQLPPKCYEELTSISPKRSEFDLINQTYHSASLLVSILIPAGSR